MVLCVAFFSFIAAFAVTALGAFFFLQIKWWYATFVAPGLLPFKLLSRGVPCSSLSNKESWLAIAITFLYYFALLFVFVFWADRRWRRKRAARIDA